MGEEKWQASAAVILILGILIAFILYLLLAPPSVVSSLGNFTIVQNNTTVTQSSIPSGAYPIYSYVGGVQNSSEMVLPFGSFSVSYQAENTSISKDNIVLTSSLFGSANYNLKFNGNSTDIYTLLLNISSVSGTPNIVIYLNGVKIYSGSAAVGKLSVPIDGVVNGQNILSIYNNIGGFAFSQSFTIQKLSLIQTQFINLSVTKSIQVPTLLGLGDFYLQFTPIGNGKLNVLVNGYNLTTISSPSDTPQNITIPQSVINDLISSLKVNPSESILPLNFNFQFSISGPGKYLIVNNALTYLIPSIAEKTISIPFSLPAENRSYVVSLYISNIVKTGNVTFTVSPSGAEFSIPTSSLRVGDNILIEPASDFASSKVNGNYTGVITISSTGLVIPTYLYIYQV